MFVFVFLFVCDVCVCVCVCVCVLHETSFGWWVCLRVRMYVCIYLCCVCVMFVWVILCDSLMKLRLVRAHVCKY